MNTITKMFFTLILVLSLSAISTAISAAPSGPIDTTLKHLETALKAIDANDFEAAQTHIKAARQSAKNIIGGSLEVKAQRGSSAISKARSRLNKDDAAGATASLKKALDIFISMTKDSEKGGRGGLK
ncbi:MAG: hypothetical protein ACU83N_12690 [Gammaproteobacteria bacterium]